MSVSPVLYSSATEEWATPQDLYDVLDSEFHFDLDVCATEENHKAPRFYTKADDGLAQALDGVCWMNPPYGKTISHWMKKAYESSQHGATVVCLVHARTDTAWWHDYVTHAAEVRFIRGRLRFGGAPNSCPFPSVLVIFRP